MRRGGGSLKTRTSVLEPPVTRHSRGKIGSVDNLFAIKPESEETSVVVHPLGLHNDLVPLAGLDLTKVGQVNKVTVAIATNVGTLNETAVQLVACDPEHGRGHVEVTAVIAASAMGDELGNVEVLADKLPVFRDTEHEAVEALVAARVAIVMVHLGVVAVVVVGVVGLCHLERGARLVGDIGDLLDSAFVLVSGGIPTAERARVVEDAGG